MSKRAAGFHDNPWRGVVYLAGGGSLFASELLTTPGASNTILDVQVPYHRRALTELLGREPEQFASDATALQLAMAAYERAVTLQGADVPADLFGIGCTAGLATNRPKRGTHRAHWAIQTAGATYLFHATYSSDRAEEEMQLNDDIWSSIEHVLTGNPSPAYRKHHIAERHWHGLLDVAQTRVCHGEHDGTLLLPGSFNPLHEGHIDMLRVGESITGRPGAFELAIRNADKPSLDYISIETRVKQFADKALWLTNAPTFEEKARLFPESIFLVGVDTLVRIANPKFYGNDHAALTRAIEGFHNERVRFLVFGRVQEQRFISLGDLTLPEELLSLCDAVPETAFRNDISSTDLRQSES